MSSGLEDFSIFELFRMEAEEQLRVLQTELMSVERGEATATSLEALMRAAHSLKGAARIVGLDPIVALTHSMEDRLVAAQHGVALTQEDIDRQLAAVDWLVRLQATEEHETSGWLEEHGPAIKAFAETFTSTETEASPEASAQVTEPVEAVAESVPETHKPEPPPLPSLHRRKDDEPVEDHDDSDLFGFAPPHDHPSRERTVRISADRFDQILSLSSETLVTARQYIQLIDLLYEPRGFLLEALHELEDQFGVDADSAPMRQIAKQIQIFTMQIEELDVVARGNERNAEQLYRTALAGRLRPFSEGVTGAQRLVRDTARSLGKQVRLEIVGDRTRVDRDILDRLEAPISHLLSNAIDHGIELPADRVAAGKPAEAHLKLHARHENGRLVITVRDDGRGINRAELQQTVVRKGLAAESVAAELSDDELFQFLFLPGFSTRDTVSTVSGRGVGLNVVQTMVQEAGGSVVVSSELGVGSLFRMTLPVTRSVVKVITIAVDGEVYAVPLVRIDHVADAPVKLVDGKPFAEIMDEWLPMISFGALLGFADRPLRSSSAPVLACGGIAFGVDRLLDQTELSVRRLDPRLGKIPGVSAASFDETGFPILILDIEDLISTARGFSASTTRDPSADLAPQILVVDDSHTVREIVRRILVKAGYAVTTAQNGLEAWNLLRLNEYDLLISDVDMPQMNGVELVTKVRDNPRLARMPVIMLSYKDREEDRRRGLEAGADFYLTKGDFEKDTFHQAVVDLIGEPDMLSGGTASS